MSNFPRHETAQCTSSPGHQPHTGVQGEPLGGSTPQSWGGMVDSWPFGKLTFECQKIAKNDIFFQKNCQKLSFFEKNANFWKCRFCNFLTFKWQLFGGSAPLPVYKDEFYVRFTIFKLFSDKIACSTHDFILLCRTMFILYMFNIFTYFLFIIIESRKLILRHVFQRDGVINKQ